MKVHGALVEVNGAGVLLLGPSGVGKSETALELVVRGGRLAADDVVELFRGEGGELLGKAPEMIQHHLEIRGVGIVFVPELYGADAVCDEAAIELICRLEPWQEGNEVERIGLERPVETLLGVERPVYHLPVRPSANMALLVDVAVREHRARQLSPSAASRLDARIRRGQEPSTHD